MGQFEIEKLLAEIGNVHSERLCGLPQDCTCRSDLMHIKGAGNRQVNREKLLRHQLYTCDTSFAMRPCALVMRESNLQPRYAVS